MLLLHLIEMALLLHFHQMKSIQEMILWYQEIIINHTLLPMRQSLEVEYYSLIFSLVTKTKTRILLLHLTTLMELLHLLEMIAI